MTTRIYVEETEVPGKYSVRKDSPTGTLLQAHSRQPLLDACRILQGQQIEGRCEMWDRSRDYPRMWCDIAWGAEKIVIEDPKGAPMRYSKFIPFKRKANVYAKEI